MANGIFDIIKGIYKKEPLIIDKIDISLCIALTNILRLNKNNLTSLKKMIEYLYYLEPKRYIMLMFILIPFTPYPPFCKGVKKIEEEKENKVYSKLAYIFDWSSRERKLNEPILNKLDLEYLKKELAIK
jgi:hypothetical protein